jgi:hypothetical protein
VTVTVLLHVAVPPAPTTVITYVIVLVGATLYEPVSDTVPIVEMLAEEAFKVVHERADVPPCVMLSEFAASVHEGATAAAVTTTVVLHVAVWPVNDVTVIVYVVDDAGENACVPEVIATAPTLVSVADTAVPVAHESVVDAPAVIELGEETIEHEGVMTVTVVATCEELELLLLDELLLGYPPGATHPPPVLWL